MRLFTKFLCILLLISLIICAIPSCTGKHNIVKDGITVEPSDSPTVSEATAKRGREVITALLNKYYQRKNTTPDDGEICAKCERILDVTLDTPLSDKKYLDLLEVLQKRGDELISSLTEKNGNNIEIISDIYLELTSRLSSEYAGNLLYGFILFAYDEKYTEHIEKYVATGKTRYKVLADEVKKNEQIFISSIGKENCGTLCELSFFTRGIFVDGALNTGIVSTLLDPEMLLFIKKFDFSGLTVTPDGYKLLLDYYSDTLMAKENASYLDELLYEANLNGDGARISAVMNDIIALLTSVKNSLTKEDVRAFRDGNSQGAVASIFSRFGEAEFATLDKIALSIQNGARYDMIATRCFGEKYAEYKNGRCAKTQDELKLAINTDSFYDTLEGYVFGISPAFSYGMNDDRA